MKTKIILSIILFMGLGLTSLFAQNPITTLQHNGATQVFYGQNSLVEAYTASVNGDTLNLSAGYFNSTNFAKRITVIGSGHFPDPTKVVEKRTHILGFVAINSGADSLHLEGLCIGDGVSFDKYSSINYVAIFRCYMNSVSFNSSSVTASKNFCTIEECFVPNEINFSYYGTNLIIKHSILSNLGNINGNAIIEGNIILHWYNAFDKISSSIIRNNICLANDGNQPLSNLLSNYITNNIFVSNSVDFGTSSYVNNYTGISLSNIFVNVPDQNLNYSYDYHLKNPELYLGTDGTQVGIYGGTNPFKEKGMPSNPQITSKTIAPETDTEGNLKVNMTVKAQSR